VCEVTITYVVGRPKGAMLTHRNMVATMSSIELQLVSGSRTVFKILYMFN